MPRLFKINVIVYNNMKKQDLINKLEKIEFSEIEIPSHRKRLKNTLISQFLKKEQKLRFFNIYKKALIPVGAMAAILLIFFVANNLLHPQYTLADARKIIMADSQTQELIKAGADVKDIKIIKNKAYALISSEQRSEGSEQRSGDSAFLVANTTEINEQITGTLVEIDLKKKKVLQVEEIITPIPSLTEVEMTKIQKIIESPEMLKLGKPEIKKIEAGLPIPTKLIEKEGEIEVITETSASVIYEIDKIQWEAKVNLTTQKLESSVILEKIEQDKK